MGPSEYMLHEHRKDMLRIAHQARLAREVQADQPSVWSAWVRQLKQLRLRRPNAIANVVDVVETEAPICPQPVLRRSS